MITRDKIRPNMIFKYCSSPTRWEPIFLNAKSLTENGVLVEDNKTNYHYGEVCDYHFFHKYNSTRETVIKAIEELDPSLR